MPYVGSTAPAVLEQLHAAQGWNFTLIDADQSCPPELHPLSLQGHRLYAHGRDCENGEDTDQLPSCRVRQESLDTAVALRLCHSVSLGADWILFMEDDFYPCLGGVQTILSTLHRGDNLPLCTKFARFTQGSGAVAFPRGTVLAFAQYLLDNYRNTPIDRALLGPWAECPDYVHGIHTLKHIGKVSTIPARNSEEYQSLYSGIRDNECGTPIQV
jgi:hypothetical protein